MMRKAIVKTAFEILGSLLWFIYTCLAVIDALCVWLMRKFEK